MDNSHEADIKTFTARKSFSFAHSMLIWLTGKTNTNLQVSQTFIILLYRGAQMICTEENECDVILGIKSRFYVYNTVDSKIKLLSLNVHTMCNERNFKERIFFIDSFKLF